MSIPAKKNPYSLEVAIEKLSAKIEVIFNTTTELIPNFLTALLIFVVALILSKIISKRSQRGLDKVSKNVSINKLIGQILGIILLMIGCFFALGVLHLDRLVTSVLAGIGILSLGFSFAFQHLASDFVSGLILVLKKNIKVGDLVKTNDVFGNIVSIELRTTKVLNVYGQIVEIPNRLITDNTIADFSNTAFRRIDITGKINFSNDLTSIKKELEQEMSEFDFIYSEKSPNMVYNELDFEKVNFTLRVWMNFTTNDAEFLNARSACLEKLSSFFISKGIEVGAKEIKLNQV